MKTQVIATLANYAYKDLGKKVLIVAPGKKAKDEIIKRYNSLFGFEIPTSIDGDIGCIITSGLLNQKKYKDPQQLVIEEAKLRKFEWVLVDEVEYTVGSDSGEFLYSRLTGADHFYGFSGSADKWGGKMISFANGIDEVVMRNKDLVKYFGPSLVHRMPLNLKIDNITVKTMSLNHVKFDEEDYKKDTNVYTTVMTKIWVHPEVCKLVVKLGKRYPMMYIPINNLSSIISTWINDYFLGVFRILLIRGSKSGDNGYIYYDLAGNMTSLTLTETCEYIKNGMVDIIPSTSAGFRALDLPGLENILLISGKNAGTVLQVIGRTARGKHMNILALESMTGKKIPVYTNGFEHRNEMVHEYYKYCDINDVIINENSL